MFNVTHPDASTEPTEAISLMAAVTLTGKSKRTLWRRLADGTLPRVADDSHGRTMVALTAVRAELAPGLAGMDWPLLLAADQGDCAAQTDLAYWFMAMGQYASAVYWLEQAARQQQPDAMQCLARLMLEGQGCAQNEEAALVWLAKAAAKGHPIARAQMAGLSPVAAVHPKI